jgi:flagellar hook-basal body complex protein FliE
VVSPLLAAKAYANATKLGSEQPSAAGKTGGPSFQQLVQNAIGDAVQASKHSEAQIAAHANGKAELVDVVTAVASAEASLETVMAVRDQVIQAYQEIMRMPI